MADSLNLAQDSHKFACHYTKLTTACEHILRYKTIQFSPMKYLNDPRESQERDVGIGWSSSLTVPPEKISEASDLLKKGFLEYSKLFCTTIDAEKNQFGLNTKRCFGRPRMWAQYGDNHHGVCFVFDRTCLTNEISKSLKVGDALWHDAVMYDDGLKNISPQAASFDYDFVDERGVEFAIKKHIERFQRALFFRKDSDWSGESEWRWVIHKWEEGYERLPFGESLKAVVIGVDCSEVYVPSLQRLADGVPLLQLVWDDRKEDFNYFEIKP